MEIPLSMVKYAFIVIIPLALTALSAHASRPVRYGNAPDAITDYVLESYRWLAQVGLDFQLAGLTSLTAAILDRGLYAEPTGLLFVMFYAIGMFFGLAHYREHRYAQTPGSVFRNQPFVIGIAILAIVEITITLT
jgi:hypothetical protein